jgi:uncharacterized membrane protein
MAKAVYRKWIVGIAAMVPIIVVGKNVVARVKVVEPAVTTFLLAIFVAMVASMMQIYPVGYAMTITTMMLLPVRRLHNLMIIHELWIERHWVIPKNLSRIPIF